MVAPEDVDDLADGMAQDLRLEIDLLLLAGGACHEEQVLDESEQTLRVDRDIGDHRAGALGQLVGPLKQPRIAEDRGHRRPKLV